MHHAAAADGGALCAPARLRHVQHQGERATAGPHRSGLDSTEPALIAAALTPAKHQRCCMAAQLLQGSRQLHLDLGSCQTVAVHATCESCRLCNLLSSMYTWIPKS